MTRRVFLLVEEVSVLLPGFFKMVLDGTPSGTEVVGAAIEPGLPPPHSGVRHHLRMAGWRRWPNLMAFQARAWVEQRPRSVAGVLRSRGIEVERVSSPNEPSFVDRLRSVRPDVAFNAGSRLLKPSVLSVPSRGWMNRHAGRLPDYRGVSPVWWALWNREPEVSVTYHRMVEAVDEGQVLWEHHEPVHPNDTVIALYVRLIEAAAHGFWDAVERLFEGDGRVVDASRGAYHRLPDAMHIKEFRRRRLRYV